MKNQGDLTVEKVAILSSYDQLPKMGQFNAAVKPKTVLYCQSIVHNYKKFNSNCEGC
jgi:hypothetical protein